MSNTVDARGLSCPQPLIMATEAYKSLGDFEIIIDNQVAKENILRVFNDKYSITPEVEERGDDIVIRIKK